MKNGIKTSKLDIFSILSNNSRVKSPFNIQQSKQLNDKNDQRQKQK